MRLTVQFETGQFTRAVREMHSRLGSVPLQAIVDYEVSKILEMAIRRTDAASVAAIRKNHASREWTTYKGKRYRLSNRYSKALWGQLGAQQKAILERRLAARGIAKQSWYALAQRLGFDIDAPAFVKNAKVNGHTNAENVTIARISTEGTYGLTISNASPVLRWTGGRPALAAAIAGRRKFYEQNLKRGVFDDLKSVAAKYPGLKVT